MAALWSATQQLKRKFRFYDQENDFGKAFIYYGEYGDLEGLRKCILERGVSFQDEHGQRPLHRASRRGHLAAVRMLLEYGSDPNIPDSVGGYTSLQYAAHYNLCDMVRLLVSYGGDIFYCNQFARPVTVYAQKSPNIAHAINNGISDLYIHRSIAASQLCNIISASDACNEFEGLNIDIALLVIEYVPRHQLWTEVKTRFVTSKTEHFHSSDIFSTQHLDACNENKIHGIQYNGEFDDDLYYSLMECRIREQIIANEARHRWDRSDRLERSQPRNSVFEQMKRYGEVRNINHKFKCLIMEQIVKERNEMESTGVHDMQGETGQSGKDVLFDGIDCIFSNDKNKEFDEDSLGLIETWRLRCNMVCAIVSELIWDVLFYLNVHVRYYVNRTCMFAFGMMFRVLRGLARLCGNLDVLTLLLSILVVCVAMFCFGLEWWHPPAKMEMNTRTWSLSETVQAFAANQSITGDAL